MSGRWFPLHPKGGCTPPINLEVFFYTHPPFTIFFDFRLRSLRYEKDFLPVLSK